jgi:hypothetical protein
MNSVIATAGYDNNNPYPVWEYITAISQGQTTTVTTAQNHDFSPGQIVSFRVSKPYGMVEINNLDGLILSKTDNTITVDINSLNWTAFVNAGIYEQYPAVVVPSSSGIVPGSFPVQTNLADAQ